MKTSARSRKEQARDFRLFIGFLQSVISSEERIDWTPRVSREFVDYLRSQIHEDGSRRFADRTVNRVIAHLKTFAKWVNSRSPFPKNEHPLLKMKGLADDNRLDLERALTVAEHRRMLDAADHLPVIGGRSRDRRRCRDVEFPDERPRRKGYRPWRNRAIIYTLLETGMRRAEVTSIDLNTIDFAESVPLLFVLSFYLQPKAMQRTRKARPKRRPQLNVSCVMSFLRALRPVRKILRFALV